MTIQFGLALTEGKVIRALPGGLTFSMSDANAERMLGILGLQARVEDTAFLPHQGMAALLTRISSEIQSRLTRDGDNRVRYELPRLEHLQVLFGMANRRGLGVVVTRLPGVEEARPVAQARQRVNQ
jgi:hypothetical protein